MYTSFVLASALVASSTLVAATSSAKSGAVPTVTVVSLGDQATASQPSSFTSTPTGTAYVVEEDDAGNLWARFSTDTQSKLQSAADANCGASKSSEGCQDALSRVLTSDTIHLEPRFFVIDDLVELSVVGGLVALLLGSQAKVPDLIRVDSSDFDHITSAAHASPTAMVIVDHAQSTTFTYSHNLNVALSAATLGTAGGGSVTTTKGCPSTPIICQDSECLAPTSTIKTCDVSSNKGCPCTNLMAITTGQLYDTTSGSVQASLLNSLFLAAGTATTKTPSSSGKSSTSKSSVSKTPSSTSSTASSTASSSVVCSDGQGSPPSTYSTTFGDDAANYFCSQGGTRQISGAGTYNKEAIYGYQDKPGSTTDVSLITRMYYVNADGCTATSTQLYEPSLQECKDNFAAAMNDCQTNTTTAKAGSYQVFNKGDAGCVAFDLMPCPNVDGKASSSCNPFYGSYNSFKVSS